MNTAKKYVVGLTGGIGSGKSAAAKIFQELGIEVVDADALAREVVEPGQPALAEIAARHGEQILAADGNLDRPALRKLVFSDPAEKDWLEKLLHPQIAKLMRQRLNDAKSPYAILESPLLLETEQHKLVERVLVIDVERETQIQRAMQRDGSEQIVIESIIASQIDRAERIKRADDIILNEASLEQLSEEVQALHSLYLEKVSSQ